MGTDPKHKVLASFVCVVVMAGAVVTAPTNLVSAGQAGGMPSAPHHSFLGGPWELVVKMGTEGEALRFPIAAPDESRPQKFDDVLPVMGTPIKVRLEQYLPNLGWETTAIKHPGGGTVAELTVKGKDFEQEVWLSSADMSKQSMSSRVGSIAIKGLHEVKTADRLVRRLTDRRTVGILSVWPGGGGSPAEYAVRIGETITVPGSKYKLTVEQYVPHYSIDLQTRKVVSQTDKPINPAVKVVGGDGTETFEQWLWSKFASDPHKDEKVPLRMKFADLDLSSLTGKTIIITAPGVKPWLLYSRKGKRQMERASLGKSYPLADASYSFTIENIIDGAVIKTDWKNKSESLLHPAVVATLEQDGAGRQIVLELNKPSHHRTEFGTLVLLYRRNPAPLGSKG
ncbi:MAG: hypothetical protein ISS70_10280 [Phycisphaerae bacterium]|nr:hypothetical protein [Phycisphaerae bacterium]